MPKPSTYLYQDGFIKEEDFKSIAASNAVGDINAFFYDSNGKTCLTSLDGRVVGMSLEQLKEINYCIGITGGREKCEAIRAALVGKIINILVINK